MPSVDYEQNTWNRDGLVAGVDEVGRGALAGPVVAAAVALSPDLDTSLLEQLDDSKKLTSAKRRQLFELLGDSKVDFAVGLCDAATIDEIGISAATARAMKKAIGALPRRVDHLLVDGRPLPRFSQNSTFIIKGDSISCSIAAASIIAKVTRDEMMETEFAPSYPQYGFAQNKGYGTKTHTKAIFEHGATPAHRHTYEPIKTLLTQPEML